jgi:hypothetical protein
MLDLAPYAGAVARAILLMSGTAGYTLSSDQANQAANGLLIFVSIVWSLWQKYHAAKQLTQEKEKNK